eukprot:4922100-Pyramimonas_sp.AAC.2
MRSRLSEGSLAATTFGFDRATDLSNWCSRFAVATLATPVCSGPPRSVSRRPMVFCPTDRSELPMSFRGVTFGFCTAL